MTELSLAEQPAVQTTIGQDISVGGLRLHTARRPGTSKVPLLLLHGLGGSMESWGPLLAAMPDRDIIMIDAPGAGRSQTPIIPIRLKGVADYIAETLEALEVERVDMLGFSLGGTIAQEFAYRHSAMVNRLVLVATVPGLVMPGKVRAQIALLSTRRHKDRAAAERDMPIICGGRTARDPEALKMLLDGRMLYPPTTRGYRYQQMSVMGWSSLPWLHRITAPTLIMMGEDDPIVRSQNGKLLSWRLPDSQLELIPGAGHMMLFDEPGRTAPLIEQFLDAPRKVA